MKVIKTHPKQLLRIYFPIVIPLAFLMAAAPFFLFQLSVVSYVFLGLSVLFIVSPIGNYSLGTEKTHSKQHSFLMLTFWQVVITLALITFSIAFSHPLTDVGTLIHHTWRSVTLQWGLYPWSLYALMACVYVFFSLQDGRPVHFMRTTIPMAHQDNKTIMGIGMIVFLRQALYLSPGLLMVVSFVTLSKLLCASFGVTFLQDPNVLLASLFFIVFLSAQSIFFEKHLLTFYRVHQYRLAAVLLIATLIVAGLVTLMEFTKPLLQSLVQQDLTARLIATTNPHPVVSYQMLLWSGILGLAPVMAQIFSRYLKGHSVRFGLLSCLWLPALAWMSASILGPLELPTLGWASLGLLGALSVIGLFARSRTLETQLQLTLERNPDTEKTYRLPKKTVTSIVLSTVMVLMMVLLTGAWLLPIFYVGTLATCFPMFAASALGMARVWMSLR